MDPDWNREICQDMSVRTKFGSINCHVRGYPSLGGIVRGSFTAVELNWLGLSRSRSSSRALDPCAKDEFCFQLLRLGALWWKSDAYYDKRSVPVSGGYSWPECCPPELHVGYPSTGGVWVLKVQSGEFEPDDFAKVIMAFTMNERCAALEEMGAVFYGDVNDCPDVAESLKDGIATGKGWEKRMKRMDL